MNEDEDEAEENFHNSFIGGDEINENIDIYKNNINDINLIEKESNNFILDPILHELPPNLYNNDTSKNSFIFTHVIKKTKVFKKTIDALDSLHARQSLYKGIYIQRNISYNSSSSLDKNKLDLYLPSNYNLSNLPIVIHFHGGGWVRGDRKDEFRGAPAICRQYCNNGIIAVAPSYRLNNSNHMEDAVNAVLWVIKNSSILGANPNSIFISGHSAGGNISSNLGIGDWLNDILHQYNVKILGIISISGVYSLIQPISGKGSIIINKVFDKMYRKPVFGDDKNLLIKHSPLAQLKLFLNEIPYPSLEKEKECKVGIFQSMLNILYKDNDNDNKIVSDIKNNISNYMNEIPFLIMNAEDDMGLEYDAIKFIEYLEKVQLNIKTKHHIFKTFTHATIALNDESLSLACDFIKDKYNNFLNIL